jgi:cytochrome d ubiquinol oxidase subunit I
MDHVFAARAQMGTSLAFHIVFAALGVGLPLLVGIAEAMWLRSQDRTYYDLARTWSKGMAILFAVGAVSGTILSFELGLLWPVFMKDAGAIIGLPFSLEGFAFFIEAIFIGLYLYSWDKLTPRMHLLTIVPVIVSGAVSAAFVTLVNAWMQMPTGFEIVNGQIVNVRPYVAMFALPWKTEVTHTTLAAYVFTGFGVAAVCAFALLRGDRRPVVGAGLRIAMIVAAIAIPLQIVVGDVVARFDANYEPSKFAAMEVLRTTEKDAPISLGGVPTRNGDIAGAIEIPDALSILVGFDPNTTVMGLNSVRRDDTPPIAATHLSFDAMVGSGSTLLVIAAAWAFFTFRKRVAPRVVLIAIALAGPLALVALEAGWFVTELGRQPWIARGLLRTADAVTTSPDLDARFFGFTLMYVVLAATCWWLTRRVGHAPKTP